MMSLASFTDSTFFNYQYARPRYLNSGSFMGPAGDLQRCFQRANDRMEEYLAQSPSSKKLCGGQGIFAEVFGEQEVWRNGLVAQSTGERDQSQQSLASELEYHIGPDYAQELFYPTCYSEHGGSFVRLQDSDAVRRESKGAGVKFPRVQKLPSDIATATDPLAVLEDSLLQPQTWDSMSLHVDYWTTSIPVAVHHNAWCDGPKPDKRHGGTEHGTSHTCESC